MWCHHPTFRISRQTFVLIAASILFAVLLTILVIARPAHATTGINKTINFQGRLLTSAGAAVPDGWYNIEFKIYQDGDGCVPGGSSPCGGTLKWTEDYLNNNFPSNHAVQVKNGFMSVNLGSVTPFGSNVDWNQDTLWLSMNVGNTNATCTPFASCAGDGEMLPMKRMTASPYALNSGQLNGLTSANFVQLAQGVQTDATTSTSSIFINKTGSGNLLQLQAGGNDAFTLNNTGDLQFGANANHTLSVATSAASTNGKTLTMSAGTGGTGTGSTGGNLTLQGGAAGGTNGTGGNVSVDAGAGTGSGADGNLNIGTTHASAIQIGSTSLASGTQTIGVGNSTGAGTTNVTIGQGSLAAAGTSGNGETVVQSKGNTIIGTNGVVRATFDTSNTLYLGNGGLAFAPNDFTVQGTSSATTGVAGASLTLQGGSAIVGTAGGGNTFVNAGAGTGGGSDGALLLGSSHTATIQVGNSALGGGATQSIGVGNNTSGSGTTTLNIGSNATGSGATNVNIGGGTLSAATNSTVLQAKNNTVIGTNNVARATFDTTGKLYLGDSTTAAGTGTFTIQGSTGAASNAGYTVALQGGTAGTGAVNGGDITLQGGTSAGGVQGQIKFASASGFTTDTISAYGSNTTIAQTSVDNFSSVSISASTTSLTITVPAPTTKYSGRILYVQLTGANSITLAPNGGTNLTMSPGTVIGLVWNTTTNGWLNAGADTNGFIQNQNGSTQTATFKISGVGTAGSFVGATLDGVSGALGIGTTGATAVSVGNVTAATTVLLQGGNTSTAVSIQTIASGTIAVGTANVNNTIQIGNTANAVTQNITIGGNANGGTQNVTIGSASGAAAGTTTIQSKGNTTFATNGTTRATFDASNNFTINARTIHNDTVTMAQNAQVGFNIQGTTGAYTYKANGNAGYLYDNGSSLHLGYTPSGTAGGAIDPTDVSNDALVLGNIGTNLTTAINAGVRWGDNLIDNGGFEYGCSGWKSNCTVESTTIHTGNKAAKYVMSTAASVGSVQGSYIAATAGSVYYAQGWIRTTAATTGTGFITICYFDKDGAWLSVCDASTATNPGTTYTFRSVVGSTAPANTAYAYVKFQNNGDGSTAGTWYYDDAYVAKENREAPLLIQNQTDSGTAFRIQNAAGNNNLLTADTINNKIAISGTSTGNTLSVSANANPAGATNALLVVNNTNGAASGNLIALQNAGTNKFTVDASGNTAASGTLTYANSGASATALVCKDGAGLLSACNTTGNGAAFIQGGNDFGGDAVLGTTQAAQQLTFKTGGSNRLTLDSTGANLTFLQAANIKTTGAQALSLDTGAGAALNIGTANSNAVAIGNTSGTFTAESNATANLFTGNTAHTVQVATNSGSAQTVTVGSTNSGSTAKIQGGAYSLVAANTGIGINTGANAPTADLTFGENAGAGRTINVLTRTTNAVGEALGISAGAGGSGAGANTGGALNLNAGAGSGTNGAGGVATLNGGAGGGGNGNGGDATVAGGIKAGSGTSGNVNVKTNNVTRAVFDTTGKLYLGDGTTSTGTGTFTLQGSTGAASNAGFTLALQGGTSGTGAVNGGDITLQGGATGGSGVQGQVKLATSGFTTSTVQNFTANAPITQANVDNFSSVEITASGGGPWTATVPAPTTKYNGRLLYVQISTIAGATSINLAPNGGNTISMNPSTAVTLVWNTTINAGAGGWLNAGADGGSNNYIQNQTSTTQTAGFKINGVGTAASFVGSSLDVASAGVLSLGTSVATTVNIGNVTAATAVTLQGGSSSTAIGIQSIASGTISVGTTNAANTIAIGSATLSSGTQAITIGGANTSGGTQNVTIGSASGATAGATTIQSKNNTTIATNGVNRAIFDTSGNLFLGTGTSGAAGTFTIQGSAGTSGIAGSVLALQGGNGGTGGANANGGNLTLSGGTAGTGGVNGLVLVTTPTFQTATTQTCVSTPCTITQANVDSSSVIVINTSGAGYVISLPNPTIAGSTAYGRLVYVTSASSADFTLAVNGGVGVTNQIAMRNNTSATMVWGPGGWTAAGASSSTTLQAAYDNTLQSSGGAELTVSKTSNTNGLTIRDSVANPVNGALLSVQSNTAANLFSVSSNVVENASNPGAETAGASSSTFPASTWALIGNAGIAVSRNTTAANIATGQASVSVVTTANANDGVKDTLTSTLVTGLTYNVSFSALLSSGTFSDMLVDFSKDGTATSPTSCATAQQVFTKSWTKVTCSFTAPASTNSSNAILIRQATGTVRTFYVDNLSVTSAASQSYVTDGGVDDAGNFATNWVLTGSSTVARSTTNGNDASDSTQVSTTTSTTSGVKNKLSVSPLASNGATTYLYRVTAYVQTQVTALTAFTIRYSRDNGTNFQTCSDYNTQAVSVSSTAFTKITCIIQTDSTSASNPYLYFEQGDAIARNTGSGSLYIDTASMTIANSTTPDVQIGSGLSGGPTTLFTLDKGSGAPIAGDNQSLLGSMYYDTAIGKIQCYQASGWGSCGSAPDTIVTISPEYTNAVMHGSNIGAMTSDFCSGTAGITINDGSGGQPTVCGSTETYNFYKWTTPQVTTQAYSIWVTYQLPSTFKSFGSGTTSLKGRVDNTTNAAISYSVYKSNGSGLTLCGTVNVATAAGVGANAWDPGTATGTADPSTCSFAASNSVVFKITMSSKSNANAYISNIGFAFSNR